MQRFITDERTGIRYELIGDYYYPCLTAEEKPLLSKYGRMRERYLKEHKRVLYYTLLTSGKLYEHLAEIDTSARDMAEYLIKEMAKKQGVTEELKATDRLAGKKYSCKEGCFFPLFQTEKELRDILQKLYKETDVHAEGSMVYFHCVK